jgi:hypothetical protein
MVLFLFLAVRDRCHPSIAIAFLPTPGKKIYQDSAAWQGPFSSAMRSPLNGQGRRFGFMSKVLDNPERSSVDTYEIQEQGMK